MPGRLDNEAAELDIAIVDNNGPKGGIDKECSVTLRMPQLPFEGEWYVFWGGRTPEQNYHVVSRSQRFSYDMLVMRDGKSHVNDGKALTDYHCFGQPILAPAAGRVARVVDGLPDQQIGSTDARSSSDNDGLETRRRVSASMSYSKRRMSPSGVRSSTKR